MAVSSDQNIFTKLGFLLGLGCIALAFIAAAAENVLGDGFVTSANDLLIAMVPGDWIAFKLRYSSDLFNAIVLPVMELPAWLIAGLPGGFLLWTCRPHREEVDEHLLDSLGTFDRLADLAKEEEAENDDPTFYEFDPRDYEDIEIPQEQTSTRKYMEEWDPHEGRDVSLDSPELGDEGEDPVLGRSQTPEEKMAEARKNLSIPFDKLS